MSRASSLKVSGSPEPSTATESTQLDAKFVVESSALLVEHTKTSSANPLVHIIWLMDGVDMWHRTGGKRGHTIEDARRYMASQLVRLPSERKTSQKASPTEAHIDE